jgi:prolyl 4-hydroxylase
LREVPLVVVIREFATPAECDKLADTAGFNLGAAAVSGSTSSRDRRTLSKNLYPIYDDADSILTQISLRLFGVTREVTGFKLQPEGQEPLNWLYYLPGYEYRPHCDGSCGASSIRLRQRVATTLLYCGVAEKGGGTVFPPDGLKYQPKKGEALLFTYNPDPDRLSEHSACPVLKGDKYTATQWYREGVTAERNWEGKTEL